MFKIIYDPEYGQVVADGGIESFVMDYVRNHSELAKVSVGSETMMVRFRLAVARGELDNEGVEFYFKNLRIPHRPDGSFIEWPKGFCDVGINLVRELTTIRRKDVDRAIEESYLEVVK